MTNLLSISKLWMYFVIFACIGLISYLILIHVSISSSSLGFASAVPKLIDLRNSSISTASNESDTTLKNMKKWTDQIPHKIFKKWGKTIPCFPPIPEDLYGKAYKEKKSKLHGGLMYIKVPKTGSSTLAGINLRIAHRHLPQNSKLKRCRATYRHVKASKMKELLLPKNTTFMWTFIRNPASQFVSEYFHFKVGRKHVRPTLESFKHTNKNYDLKHPPQINFISHRLPLRTEDLINNYTKKNLVQEIMNEYDFIGVTERLDESLVALRLILGLDAGDILYVSSKVSGGYDDGANGKCTKIPKAILSQKMKKYLSSKEFNELTSVPKLLHQAANKSLDLTIQNTIGQDVFDKALEEHKYLMSLVNQICASKAIFPCSKEGKYQGLSRKNCYSSDNGCGYPCLDKISLNYTVSLET